MPHRTLSLMAWVVVACIAYSALNSTMMASATATSSYKGDHYDSTVTNGMTTYSKSVWNYDYSHTLVGGVCKDANLATVTCSTATQCGPACWGIAPNFGGNTNMCAGTSQTPINLAAANIDPTLSPPEFIVTDGGCDKWVQFGDDHAFEVAFDEPGKKCTNLQLKYAGTTYTLQQFHFHAPAEHAVASGLGSAELHMVHTSADGKLLVLGVIMNSNGLIAGGGNQFLRTFWDVAHDGYQKIHNDTMKPMCATFNAFSAPGSTTLGSAVVTFASAPTSMPIAGDILVDPTGSSCFSSGLVVVSATATTVTMSSGAQNTCAGKTFNYATSSKIATEACDPDFIIMAKELNIQTAIGSDIMAGQCKYAFEYDAEGQVSAVHGRLSLYCAIIPGLFSNLVSSPNVVYPFRRQSIPTSTFFLRINPSSPTRAL